MSARRSGLLLALAGAVAFSGKAIIVKLGYRHGSDPVTMLGLRMLLALPLFVALAWWAGRGAAPLAPRDRWAVGGLGFAGYYLASFLDFLGLQHISAGLERLILYLNPTLVLGLGWLLYRRRVSARQLLALGISYTGVLLAVGQEVSLAGERVALGVVLVFASAVSYALYLVHSAEVLKRVGSLRLTGLATSVACLLCVGQWLLWQPMPLQAIAPAVWWLSALNALACTFAPVLMVMLAMERIGPAATAQAGMVGPMATVALGVLLLGEHFTLAMGAGTVLVLAGVALLARSR